MVRVCIGEYSSRQRLDGDLLHTLLGYLELSDGRLVLHLPFIGDRVQVIVSATAFRDLPQFYGFVCIVCTQYAHVYSMYVCMHVIVVPKFLAVYKAAKL